MPGLFFVGSGLGEERRQALATTSANKFGKHRDPI
jgi:hypothetical protein